MYNRLFIFLSIAFIPIVILGFLFPDRLFDNKANLNVDSIAGADIVAFVSKDCPHCKDFKEYASLQEWEVEYHEISESDSQSIFANLQERAPDLQQGVPTIILNGEVIQGYKDHETTGKMLKERLNTCEEFDSGCLPFKDFLQSDSLVEVTSSEGICIEDCEDTDKFVFNLPILGKIDLTLLSLPVLSILLGFLDGFNPCAMWVLITLLTLLINTKDMRKVWLIGGTFLFVSGAVYYLFIAAWLNAFLLIGFNMWVQKIIGIVAIGGGGFYLYEAFGKNPNACQITNVKQKKKTTKQMRAIIQKTFWPAMILGVAILAFSVNLIELVCTAGLPAIFTQILAFNDVSNLARYSYIGLYILLYMIDDLVIFAIAVYTLHTTGLAKKYARFALIFGGILMYVLGILLIFAPEAMMSLT